MSRSPIPGAPQIRRARPEEAAALTALAHRSKAVWGYDAAFMAASAPDLTLNPETVRRSPVYLAQIPGTELGATGGEGGSSEPVCVGFYALSEPPAEPELEQFFVEPELLGRGVGRALWHHACATARELGWSAFRIAADPNAEPFYRRMGARPMGTIASIVSPERRLPLLIADLPPAKPRP